MGSTYVLNKKSVLLKCSLYAWFLLTGGNAMSTQSAVPPPQKVKRTDITVGVFRCPLWSEQVRPDCWKAIEPFPERTPLTGYYDESNPEFVDWEIKYALEHGISFFWECWFREKGNENNPEVKATLDHWLEKGFFKSKYQSRIKFAILWENTNAIASGVGSESDLLDNLVPYWIKHYFSRPNYMKIGGKPLFMIYGFNDFIEDLGGVPKAKQAVSRMKEVCQKAGLKGLYLVAEYHGRLDADLNFLREIGFDAITSYHWPSFSGLMDKVPTEMSKIIELQCQCWEQLPKTCSLPSIPTLSMGWDSQPWGRTYYQGAWYLTPDYFQRAALEARNHIRKQPQSEISKLVMVDNWNEFGEGHYVFPTRQFGFGYLDALRNVFTRSPLFHEDILPQEIGMGPYR